jgi:hypothetical protein
VPDLSLPIIKNIGSFSAVSFDAIPMLCFSINEIFPFYVCEIMGTQSYRFSS